MLRPSIGGFDIPCIIICPTATTLFDQESATSHRLLNDVDTKVRIVTEG